jgi:hypothetical protein
LILNGLSRLIALPAQSGGSEEKAVDLGAYDHHPAPSRTRSPVARGAPCAADQHLIAQPLAE